MFLDAGPPGARSIQYSEKHYGVNRVSLFFENIFQLLKVLTQTRIQINEAGTLSVSHGGSQFRMRQDGNIDLISSRNILVMTPQGLIHLNPVSVSDDRFTQYLPEHASQSA